MQCPEKSWFLRTTPHTSLSGGEPEKQCVKQHHFSISIRQTGSATQKDVHNVQSQCDRNLTRAQRSL